MRLESLTRFANIAFNPSRTTINTNHLEFGRQGLATMVPLLAKTVGFSYIYIASPRFHSAFHFILSLLYQLLAFNVCGLQDSVGIRKC